MDDLISRKAAIEAMKKWATQPVIKESRHFEPKGKAIVLDMIGVVTEQPTVPAVPLDKLCEWLSALCDTPCMFAEGICDKNYCKGYKPSDAECWRYVLTKWMEGQHD